MQFTIRKKLILTFTSFLILAVIISIISFKLLDKSRKDSLLILNNTNLFTDKAEYLNLEMLQMSDSLKALMLDPTNLTEKNKKLNADNKFDNTIEELKQIATQEKIQNHINQISELDEKQINPLENKIMEKLQTNVNEALKLYKEKYVPLRELQSKNINLLIKLVTEINDNIETELDNKYNRVRSITYLLLFLLVITGLIFTLYLSANIATPIGYLRDTAMQITAGNLELKLISGSKDETGELIKSFGQMIESLKANKLKNEEINWLKDGINKLANELSGDNSLSQLTNKAISYISRYLDAGSGCLYVFDQTENILRLTGTFAFTERNHLSNIYKLGEGVIGQVALEKKPILLKNISRQEMVIKTGIVNEPPLKYLFISINI